MDETFINNNNNPKTRSTKGLFKNLIVISLSWVFLFTGFFSLANLQSSLNSDANLGTLCMSVIYVTLIFGSTFFPKLLVRFLGLKWTIVASQFGYLIYVFANLYPTWFTLLPASVLLGFASSSLWVTKNLYVKEIYLRVISSGQRESGKDPTTTLNRYMSLFFAMFLSSQIWANLISSLILKPEVDVSNPNQGSTDTEYCGANGCPWHQLHLAPLKKPKIESVYILCGVLATLTVVSILINVIFLDNLKRGESEHQTEEEAKQNPIKKFFKQLTHRYQILITPFSLWIGFIQGFMAADFTRYFVACVFGIHNVGFYFMFYGISLTIGCILNGFLIKHIGRIVCLVIGALFYFPTLVFMLIWKPVPDLFFVFLLMAVLIGIAVSFWEPNVNAAIGIYFPKSSEEAFSIFKLWESAGFFITFFFASYVCVWFKIYVLIGVGALAALGYLTIEILIRKSKKNSL